MRRLLGPLVLGDCQAVLVVQTWVVQVNDPGRLQSLREGFLGDPEPGPPLSLSPHLEDRDGNCTSVVGSVLRLEEALPGKHLALCQHLVSAHLTPAGFLPLY